MSLKTVAVGIDRSPAAANALRWAIGFAATSHASVRAVSTWQMPFIGVLPGPVEGLPSIETMADLCSMTLSDVVTAVAPEAELTSVVVEGKPGPALLEATTDADLLVVGRTGQGRRSTIQRVTQIVLGSTARHCIHHAQIPVATVPEDWEWLGPETVVVGVDGSASSLAALEWALANAPASATLRVVRAFVPWVGDGLTPFDLINDRPLHDAFRQETQDWVDAAIKQQGLTVNQPPLVDVKIGNARDVLANREYEADLIVVGERGHTGVAAMVLGSVSDHLVRYASCPVVVVPDPTTA